MRFHELTEARPWRRYEGRVRPCALKHGEETLNVSVTFGLIETGRTRTFQGYFVRLDDPDGGEWLGTDGHSMRRALADAAAQAARAGYDLLAVGVQPEWRESGLSFNSGWGYHPDFEGRVHMLASPVSF